MTPLAIRQKQWSSTKYNSYFHIEMWVSQATQQKFFGKHLARPQNQKCADCNSKSPTWASIDYGVLVCLNCSGAHRALGPSVTRVKSTKLDTWMSDWFEYMTIGNEVCNRYWQGNIGINKKPNTNTTLDQIKKFVADKYVKKKFAVPGEKDPVTLMKMMQRGELQPAKPKEEKQKVKEQTPEDIDKASRESNPDDNLWDFEDVSPVSKPSGTTEPKAKISKKDEVDLMEFSEPSHSQPKRAHSLEHSVPPPHNQPAFHAYPPHFPYVAHHSTPPQIAHPAHPAYQAHPAHPSHFYQHPQHNIGHTNLHFGVFQPQPAMPSAPAYYPYPQPQPISMNMNISMNMYANNISFSIQPDPPVLKMTESEKQKTGEPFADFDEFRNLRQK